MTPTLFRRPTEIPADATEGRCVLTRSALGIHGEAATAERRLLATVSDYELRDVQDIIRERAPLANDDARRILALQRELGDMRVALAETRAELAAARQVTLERGGAPSVERMAVFAQQLIHDLNAATERQDVLAMRLRDSYVAINIRQELEAVLYATLEAARQSAHDLRARLVAAESARRDAQNRERNSTLAGHHSRPTVLNCSSASTR